MSIWGGIFESGSYAPGRKGGPIFTTPFVFTPAAPTSLTVTPISTDSMFVTTSDLAWSRAVDPLHFTVYYSFDTGATWLFFATYAGNLRSASGAVGIGESDATTLVAITATTADGESARSNVVTVPAAFTISSAVGSSDTTITVASNAAGTIVWQTSSDGGTTWVVNALTTASGNETGLAAVTTYLSSVQGTSGGNKTWFSVPSSATTTPAVPTALAAVPIADQQASISYTPPAGSISSYNGRHSTDPAGISPAWTQVNGIASPWQPTSLADNVTHYFQVQAVGAGGAGPWSSSASTTISSIWDFTDYLRWDSATSNPVVHASNTIALSGAAAYTTNDSGEILNALSLDQTANTWATSTWNPMTAAEWSISMWINPVDFSANPAVGVFQDNNNFFCLDINNNANLYCISGVGGVFQTVGYGGVAITDNIWQMVTIAQEGSAKAFFVNGVILFVDQTASQNPTQISPTSFRYGSNQQSGTKAKGKLDEFCIHNRLRTSPEELALVGAIPYPFNANTGWESTVMFTFDRGASPHLGRMLQSNDWTNYAQIPMGQLVTAQSFRDPSVIWDGTYFWAVYTRLFAPVTSFGVAKSKTGLVWEEVAHVDCSGVTGCTHAYAPTWAFDTANGGKTYVIISISVDSGSTFQPYYAYPTDADLAAAHWHGPLDATAITGSALPANMLDLTQWIFDGDGNFYIGAENQIGGYMGLWKSASLLSGYNTAIYSGADSGHKLPGTALFDEAPKSISLGGGNYRVYFDQFGADATKGLGRIDYSWNGTTLTALGGITQLVVSSTLQTWAAQFTCHGTVLPYPFPVTPIVLP